MPLLSPIDDFLIRSLGPVKDSVARLRYLGEIRRNSVYLHWGMERAYGPERANEALAEIHSRLWLDVLRTPIKRLRAEASINGLADLESDRIDLPLSSPELIPFDTRGGSVRHMRLIATTLSMLRERHPSTHQAA